MNYYNPYFYSMPTSTNIPKVGFLSRIFGKSGITLGSILNGTQRALNFANQAIPLVKQVKPMIGNAKTMFRVMNEFKRTEKPIQNNINNVGTNNNIKKDNIYEEKIDKNKSNIIEKDNYSINNGPTFFI